MIRRTKIILKTLCFTLFIAIFSSCSFQRNLINPSRLSANTLTTLNGTYEIKNTNADSITKKYWMYNNFLTEIDRKILSDTLKIDSLKSYSFNLTILSPKSCKINYVENNKVIRERIIKTKLKRDGYLYLKNKNVALIFIPYLAGAIDIKKARFSKTQEGNLIFDVASHRSGAFLLIMFLDGRTWKYRNEYKRIR